MLHRLKGADGATKLHAELGVFHARIEQRVRATHHLGSQRDGGAIHHARKAGGEIAARAQPSCRAVREHQFGLTPRGVDSGETAPREAFCARLYRIEG